jgi:nucleoside-diphosphate kinase
MEGKLTFSMIKPDAVRSKHVGSILAMIEKAGFTIKAMSIIQLTPILAERFYEVHAHRPFYKDLCTFIASGSVVAMVLEKEHAVLDLRKLMGATNPAEAVDGTIRKAFATSIDHNAIHGSDADETAAVEISFFFPRKDLV